MPTSQADSRAADGFTVIHHASLLARNTFGVAALADRLVILNRSDAVDAALGALDKPPALVLGGGSNVLLTRNVSGGVLAMQTRGRKRIDEADQVLVEAEAGENWHELVMWTLREGLAGLENLALIPGTAGAAPVQNIGAYGVELADVFDSLDAVSMADGRPHRLGLDDCRFGYRDSRFKRAPAERLLILRLRLRLARAGRVRVSYGALAEELAARRMEDPTPAQVADAVCAIRRRRLPDPARLGNAGSFFKNPTVDARVLARVRAEYPEVPAYPSSDAAPGRSKVPAAWLIDRCGWRGRRRGAAGVHADHALVLVNHGGASGAQILSLADEIRESVRARFGVDLEPEPTII